ncbi:MAG: hypothetical protein ABSH22_21315, partial [Tepidisphaeraceae bacterium]
DCRCGSCGNEQGLDKTYGEKLVTWAKVAWRGQKAGLLFVERSTECADDQPKGNQSRRHRMI